MPDEGAFVVELDHFSGPLDLLLTLIRDEQVEITDIPVARICEQFLSRIHSLGLTAAAEYLEMAARLLRIKAQMLLPHGQDDEGWEDPRAELVRRLLEYQQMREVVDLLEHRGESRRNRFARGWNPSPAAEPASEAPLALSLPQLLAAVDRVLRAVREPGLHDVVPRALDVDGAISLIRRVLELRSRVGWSDVVRADAEPWQVLSALLALLELARKGEVRLYQPKPFAALEIARDAASEAA
jgi:segregation and condensation protein A